MPAVFASSAWPSSPTSPRTFGREVVLAAWPGAPRAWQWLLRRNCSIGPRQLAQVYLSLCVTSLAIGGFFLLQGAPMVLAFAGVELMAVGAALLVFARHAADRETLTLVDGSLHIEQCLGGQVHNAEFASDWVTVEPVAAQGSLVRLSSRGRTLRVGRFVRPELRAAFARELRQALRSHKSWPPVSSDTLPPDSEPK